MFYELHISSAPGPTPPARPKGTLCLQRRGGAGGGVWRIDRNPLKKLMGNSCVPSCVPSVASVLRPSAVASDQRSSA